jgi:hypothetical protein
MGDQPSPKGSHSSAGSALVEQSAPSDASTHTASTPQWFDIDGTLETHARFASMVVACCSEAQPVLADARQQLGAASAHLLAWVAMALVNAIVLFPLHSTEPSSVRLLVHAYDAGHHIGVGLLIAGAVWLWKRLAAGKRVLGYVATGVGALACAALTLPSDLSGLAGRMPGSDTLAYALLFSTAALAVVIAAVGGARFAAPRWRWIVAVLAVGGMLANHFVLVADYPGVHLWIAGCAAVMLGQALVDATLPIRGPRSVHLRRALLAVMAIGSGLALATQPTGNVWRRLFVSSGSVVAPQLARLRAKAGAAVALWPSESVWFVRRDAVAPIQPSKAYVPGVDPIVILLTVDALRADLLEDDQYADRLPALHGLKAAGTYFSQARSTAAATNASLMSMFTGKYYSQIRYSESKNAKGKTAHYADEDPSPRFTQLLSNAGVRTFHFAADRRLAQPSFVRFDEYVVARKGRGYAKAGQVFATMFKRLRAGVEGPAFMYSHLLDPHVPYRRGSSEDSLFERYVKEVEYVDSQLGKLVHLLEEEDLWDRVLLVVSADHGEAFGEHRHWYHSVSIYEEVTRVPLIFRGPGVARRVVREPVLLLDLGPTILDVFGLPTPGTFMGQSLAAFLAGRSAELTRPIALDTSRRLQGMVFADGMKAIVDLHKKTSELYNLNVDPSEKNNLIDRHPNADQYIGTMLQFFKIHTPDGYVPPRRRF